MLPVWAKKILLDNIQRQINHQIEMLADQIQNGKDLQKDITPRAQELILESLEAIRE